MPEYPTNPDIERRRSERLAKDAAAHAEGLTVAERLTRRAKEQIVELKLTDEGGEFIICMRQPTRAEMESLQSTQEAIKNDSTYDEANDELCTMLAHLCTDESLTYEFWHEGAYSMADLIEIITKLFASLVGRVKAAQSFRAN